MKIVSLELSLPYTFVYCSIAKLTYFDFKYTALTLIEKFTYTV